MTKFKVYRVGGNGSVQVQIVDAYDWMDLFSRCLWMGNGHIFKVEVYSGPDAVEG